ncbi:MAG: YlmC/YmxH family sporulation protein [Bacilli bacterium]|nr:YlmC/YmxH family sporulation protein [Bacilli bacterium]
MRASDLMMKKVINVVDGMALGEVIDYEIDGTNGAISSFVIEQIGKKKIFSFSKGEHELVVPFSSIVTIGEDVILVNYGKNSNFVI